MTERISIRAKLCLLPAIFFLMNFAVFSQQIAGNAEVTGTVISEKNEFLSGVTVEARTEKDKTPVTVLTDSRGVFVFRHLVIGRKYDFYFQSVGYERNSFKGYVVKQDNQKNTLLIKLKENNNQLDEVVVTGQGMSVSKRRISTNVTTISAKQLRDIPSNRLDQLLQAQVPNAQFRLNGGQAGGTSLIQTRGFNSAFANSTPIIYVDGVRVDNLNTAPNVGMNLSGGISQGASTSAIADIPLENIERIEFVNGGAATTLYGSDAANGVLQIFTKKRGGGKTNFFAGVDLGLEKATNDYLYFKRTKDLLFKDGMYQKYSIGADGGSEDYGFSVGASYSKSNGTLIHNQNQLEKINFKTGMYAKLIKGLTYEATLSYNNQSLNRVRNGNSGGYSALWFAEDGASKIIGPGFNPKLDNLTEAEFARVRSFVDSAEMLQNNTSKVNRFQTSQILKFQPLKNLQFKGSFGVDYRTQTEVSIVSQAYIRHIRANSTGSLSKYDRNYLGLTMELTGQYDARLGDFSFLTTGGGQLFRTDDHQIGYIGQDIWDGAQTIELAATKTSAEFYARVANYGLFIQENIGYKNRYFIDMGVRGDGNSAFGKTTGTQYYPKAGISYIFSAEPFFQSWRQKAISTVKLRANYGVAGNFPTAFANERTILISGFNGSKYAVMGLPGNDELRPEKLYSREAGIDLGLLRDKLTVSATYFDNEMRSALFQTPLAASTGRNNILRNLGNIGNKGWEFNVNATVVETKDWEVKARASANTVDNIVLSMNGAPSFNLSGMTSRTVQTVVKEGYPVGYISGNYGVFNSDGTLASTTPQAFLGSTIPTLTGSFGLNIRYRRLSFFANADYQKGGYLDNWDKQFRFNYGASTEGVPAAEIAKNGTTNWLNFSQLFVQKSDFLKVRTMGMVYEMPASVTGKYIRRLTLALTAVNPLNFVASESDPEAVMPGGAQGQGTATTGGLNYAAYSAPRQFIFAAKINF